MLNMLKNKANGMRENLVSLLIFFPSTIILDKKEKHLYDIPGLKVDGKQTWKI